MAPLFLVDNLKSMKYIDLVTPLIYMLASLPIFNKIYETTQLVIDEEFHLPQGAHYCNKRFSEWDPKITTFPGLYIISCLVIPFNMCTVYGLRFISLLASVFNVFLILKIRKELKKLSPITAAVESITVGLLPPMYFFSHLYYTDVLSLCFVLGMYYSWRTNSHNVAAILGALSVLVRQTNVVWVVMLLGTCFLDEIKNLYACRNRIKNTSKICLFNSKTLYKIITSWGIILQGIVNTLSYFYGYIIIVSAFLAFIAANGSIVVGDKSAHETTLHIPQLFYFVIFTLFFGAPLLIDDIKPSLTSFKSSWKSFALGAVVIALIVQLNTIAHPYLLADNRHYSFYIWNRFYGKYKWFKFVIIPFYMLGLNLLQKTTKHLTDSFQIMFWIATFTALCGQKLLEFRYFLIPFIIWRINLRNVTKRHILCELVLNVIINFFTLMVFFKKEIYWSNYTEPQRIIW